MTVQLKRKKKLISKQLQEAIDAIPSPDFEKLQPRVDRVFTIGREEGLKDKEIGKLIRQKMKGHYGHSTIWRIFENYPDAKQKKNRIYQKKYPKMGYSDEEHKNEDEETGADKYAFYRDTIATKNKLLKEKDEEINGLKKQHAKEIADKNKEITALKKRIQELEIKLNKPKMKKKEGTMQDKTDLITRGLIAREQELIGQERRRSSDE